MLIGRESGETIEFLKRVSGSRARGHIHGSGVILSDHKFAALISRIEVAGREKKCLQLRLTVRALENLTLRAST